VIEQADRLRALVGAGIALGSAPSLDELLQRLVETAAALTGARYAALGVIDGEGEGLERFITTGIDEDARAAIGDPPHGRGILGVLIHNAETLRLHDISDDPRSVGFPPDHPPMHTFLGVPVMLRDVAYGNLYLTDKSDAADFDEEDAEMVTLLAAQAAVAIENARLYESATTWSSQLEALNDVGLALASEIELPGLLALVTKHLRTLIAARLVAIALPRADGVLLVEAADGDGARGIIGLELERAGSKSGRVLERRRAELVDDLRSDPEVDYDVARPLAATTGLYAPLVARDRAIGVLIAHDKVGADPRFSSDDLRLAEQFAVRAAVAVDQSARVAREALRRVIETQELERRRLARELHDQTGQELTSVLLGLKAVEEAEDADSRAAALAQVRGQIVETLHDVRRLAVELRPKALDDFGLVAASERLAQTFAEQTGIKIDFLAQLGGERLGSEIETALYRMIQEALTNIVKHAGARNVSVVLARSARSISAIVEDDGQGFDTSARLGGMGLDGMRERLALVEGTLKIESRQGGGTTLFAEVPVP
jgi:signal transduction histidine kinase